MNTTICKNCGSVIEGVFCNGSNCLYRDWPQSVQASDLLDLSDDQIKFKYGISKRFPVYAEIYSQDGSKRVCLDVEPFLRKATNQELRALHSCDWGLDHSAKMVALYFTDTNSDVADLIAYVRSTGNPGGFDCDIHVGHAMDWLKATNQPLFNELEFIDQESLFVTEEAIEF